MGLIEMRKLHSLVTRKMGHDGLHYQILSYQDTKTQVPRLQLISTSLTNGSKFRFSRVDMTVTSGERSCFAAKWKAGPRYANTFSRDNPQHRTSLRQLCRAGIQIKHISTQSVPDASFPSCRRLKNFRRRQKLPLRAGVMSSTLATTHQKSRSILPAESVSEQVPPRPHPT